MKIRSAVDNDWEYVHECTCGFNTRKTKELKTHYEKIHGSGSFYIMWSNHHKELKEELIGVNTTKGIYIIKEGK